MHEFQGLDVSDAPIGHSWFSDWRVLGAVCAVSLGTAIGVSQSGVAQGALEVALFIIAVVAIGYSSLALLITAPGKPHIGRERFDVADRAVTGEPYFLGNSTWSAAGTDNHGGSDASGGGDSGASCD